MDPLACLLAADKAIALLELDEAHEYLNAYAEWRLAGGFEPLADLPVPGDMFHAFLTTRYMQAVASQTRNTDLLNAAQAAALLSNLTRSDKQ